MIWFTSDLHFGHDKPFIYEPRGFEDGYDAAYTIITHFQEKILWYDDLYILGDCMLGVVQFGISCLSQLPGRKHLIFGNHDTDERIKLFKQTEIFTSMEWGGRLKSGKYSFYLSHYPMMMGNYKERHPIWNLSGHTHSKDVFQYGDNCVYNVALDAHDNYPVSLEQIVSDITAYREIHPVVPFEPRYRKE